MRTIARRLRAEGHSIGLVPTFGGLHEGHLALVRKSRELAKVTIVSITSDIAGLTDEGSLKSKRRLLTQDIELLVPTGINYVFAPNAKHLLPEDAGTQVVMRDLSDRLFGSLRPGYYNLVVTLLAILFNVIEPDFVCLGQKDPQLLAVAERLVEDLQFALQVVSVPVVRESDGVAAAWWLRQMTLVERQAATTLYKALEKAQVLFGAGERDTTNLVKAIREVIDAEPLAKIEYLGIVDKETLEPIPMIDERPALAVMAASIGKARLMDNIILSE
jgi:pantoate--beta-alanine ligase